MKTALRLLLLVVFAFASNAHAQVAESDPIDLVHFGDVVDVDFIGSSDNDWRGGVAPDGTLDTFVSYTKPIPAVCRSAAAIAADIEAAFSKILRDPKVSVRIVDRSKRAPVTVTGAVRTPTRFKLMRAATLRELIIRSQGFTDDAGGDISILRPGDAGCRGPAGGPQSNGLDVTRIKISDLLKGSTSANVRVFSGDTIEVERSAAVYVIGAVNNPRPVFFHAEMTISRAIAMAGGVSKDAEGGKATIFRRESGQTSSTVVEIDNRHPGAKNDVLLKPFDIIDVAGKGGGKRNFPPIADFTDRSAADRVELPVRIIEPGF